MNNHTSSEEKILLTLFQSAESLKSEISKRIARRQSDWDFVNLRSCGSFLYLVFKPKR